MNNGLWPAAQSFYDMIEGLVVKTHSYILTVLRVTFKNCKTSYLTYRHAAHTGVQYARPCIGAHFTDEWEPLLPADTVEMDRLPLEGNKQLFTQEGEHQHIVLSGFLNVLQSSRRWKWTLIPFNEAESIHYILTQRSEVGAGMLCLPCSFEEQTVAIVCVRYFLYDSFWCYKRL